MITIKQEYQIDMEHTLQEQLLDFYENDLDLELDSGTLDCFSFTQEEY